jgi:hypothetical protein
MAKWEGGRIPEHGLDFDNPPCYFFLEEMEVNGFAFVKGNGLGVIEEGLHQLLNLMNNVIALISSCDI